MSSKEEIYDYVMNDPSDTNASVLSSLLNGLPEGSSLPDITEEDFGKILAVNEGGEWEAGTEEIVIPIEIDFEDKSVRLITPMQFSQDLIEKAGSRLVFKEDAGEGSFLVFKQVYAGLYGTFIPILLEKMYAEFDEYRPSGFYMIWIDNFTDVVSYLNLIPCYTENLSFPCEIKYIQGINYVDIDPSSASGPFPSHQGICANANQVRLTLLQDAPGWNNFQLEDYAKYDRYTVFSYTAPEGESVGEKFYIVFDNKNDTRDFGMRVPLWEGYPLIPIGVVDEEDLYASISFSSSDYQISKKMFVNAKENPIIYVANGNVLISCTRTFCADGEYAEYEGVIDSSVKVTLIFDYDGEDDEDTEIIIPIYVDNIEVPEPKTISFSEYEMELDEDGYITNEDVIEQLDTARVGDIFYFTAGSKWYVPATFYEGDAGIICTNICFDFDMSIAGIYNIQNINGRWHFSILTGER